ncbi:MAG: RluA family pseudouridine synthase [Planctomycetota bacterium]|nr:RluA family pseudouridine synthase [Planctomycetota bacterium]MDA1105524.1 RluA family pseudouridine synthase [Planctomycetota bacterium]
MTERDDDIIGIPGGAESLIGTGGKVDREALFALYEQSGEFDDDNPVTVTFQLARDLEKRLDRYLVDRVPFLSRTALQRLIDEEAVTVNGRIPKASTKLRRGDRIVATLPPPPSSEIPAEEIPLDILFEDAELIIVNKQAGLIVHPARSHKSGTLINGLAWHFKHRSGGALSSVGRDIARPGVVHRLDKMTSGVMVAAKSDTAHWRLAKQFERRTTQKRYLALVHGIPEPEADLIDLPLGKHPTIREKYAVRHDETGKSSQTVYRTLEQFTVRDGADGSTRKYALLELELRTGRTHQIRVHLSHLGYPIVGDDMYGGVHITAAALGAVPTPGTPGAVPLITRQSLHAGLLGIKHPITDAPMEFRAPLAADIQRLIDLLRANGTVRSLSLGGTQLQP